MQPVRPLFNEPNCSQRTGAARRLAVSCAEKPPFKVKVQQPPDGGMENVARQAEPARRWMMSFLFGAGDVQRSSGTEVDARSISAHDEEARCVTWMVPVFASLEV